MNKGNGVNKNLTLEIQQAEEQVKAAKFELIRLIALARMSGASWQDIANVLGCSRQNARMRFSKYFEEQTTITLREDLI